MDKRIQATKEYSGIRAAQVRKGFKKYGPGRKILDNGLFRTPSGEVGVFGYSSCFSNGGTALTVYFNPLESMSNEGVPPLDKIPLLEDSFQFGCDKLRVTYSSTKIKSKPQVTGIYVAPAPKPVVKEETFWEIRARERKEEESRRRPSARSIREADRARQPSRFGSASSRPVRSSLYDDDYYRSGW
jgi:hypothetical protein